MIVGVCVSVFIYVRLLAVLAIFWRELIDCAGLGSVGCLLSIVVLGAAIDDVLPGHADKVDNLVVVVVRLQLLGRNKPQVDLLDLLPHRLRLLWRLLLLLLLHLPLWLWLVLEVRWFGHGRRRRRYYRLVVETRDAIAAAAAGADDDGHDGHRRRTGWDQHNRYGRHRQWLGGNDDRDWDDRCRYDRDGKRRRWDRH